VETRNNKFILLGVIVAISAIVFYIYDSNNNRIAKNQQAQISAGSARTADDKPAIQAREKLQSPDETQTAAKNQIPNNKVSSDSDAIKNSQNVKPDESSESDNEDIALDGKAAESQGVSVKLPSVNNITRNVSMISMKTPELTPVAGFSIVKSSKAEIEKLKKSQLK